MKKDAADQLKQLILDEIQYRKEFREARAKLEELVSEVSRHVKECCVFWNEHLSETDEIVMTMDNGVALKIKRPTPEKASCESYLPFGMDFTQLPSIQVEPFDIGPKDK